MKIQLKLKRQRLLNVEIECYNKNLNELLNYVKSDAYHFKPSD